MKRINTRIALLIIVSIVFSLFAYSNLPISRAQELTASECLFKNPTMNKSVSTWDCIWFGNYYQNDINNDGRIDDSDKTPIKWRVLNITDDELFLLSDKILDYKWYGRTNDTVWGNSMIRSWLNGYDSSKNSDKINFSTENFYNIAFTEDEKKNICDTHVHTEGTNGVSGGNDTVDKVFLLSREEVTNKEYGFHGKKSDGDPSRQAIQTEYSSSNREVFILPEANQPFTYLLRTPDYHKTYKRTGLAASVWGSGLVADATDATGGWGLVNFRGIRPAIKLKKKGNYKYAGIVRSDGFVNEDIPLGFPIMSDEDAKVFLAFIYNVPAVEDIGVDNNHIFDLLTGRLVADKTTINLATTAFLTFVKTTLDEYIDQTGKSIDMLRNNLINYLKSELSHMKEEDASFISSYQKNLKKILDEEIIQNVISYATYAKTGIMITERNIENIKLAYDSIDELINIPSKVKTYIDRVRAAFDGVSFVIQNEKRGRYSYFNSYLNNRKNYSSSDDETFQFIMNQNFEIAKQNNESGVLIDIISWFSGKDSWIHHRTDLDRWAEHLYSIEQFVLNNCEDPITSSIISSSTSTPSLSASPSTKPSASPSTKPSVSPSTKPSASPSAKPSAPPSMKPSASPSIKPTASPSTKPSASPSTKPTTSPSTKPSASPTVAVPVVSLAPTTSAKPTITPTIFSTPKPIATPTINPIDTFYPSQSPIPGIEQDPNASLFDENGLNVEYIVTENSVNYRISNSGVAAVSTVGENIETLNISKYVMLSGNRYDVSEIDEYCFSNMASLKKIIIGKNVNKICKYAFLNCSNLKKITIFANNLDRIENGAFKNINKKAIFILKGSSSNKKRIKRLLKKKKTGWLKTMRVT